MPKKNLGTECSAPGLRTWPIKSGGKVGNGTKTSPGTKTKRPG